MEKLVYNCLDSISVRSTIKGAVKPTDIVRVVAYQHSHNPRSKHSQRWAIISVNYAICDVLMIRFYSLFVIDNDLLASPFVQRFNVFHDLTLHLGAVETVNFLLQHPLSPKQYEQLNIIYDPHTITIKEIDVKSFTHQSLLTITLIPKELGSLRIGFAYPQTEQLHQARMKNIHSPLTQISYQDLHKKALTTH